MSQKQQNQDKPDIHRNKVFRIKGVELDPEIKKALYTFCEKHDPVEFFNEAKTHLEEEMKGQK